MEKGGDGASRSFDDVGDSVKKASREVDDFNDKSDKNHKALSKMGKAFKEMFEPLGKLLKLFKYFGIDMLAMIATLGAFKLALITGQAAIKAYNFSLYAMGAAAGAAVAALATVLGAMRELQLAQLKPILSQVYTGTGATSPAAIMSSISRDRRLGMFGAEAGNAVAAYARVGQKVDANQLARLGDFTAGDPKAFATIAGAMAQAQKAGELTGETYKEFQKSAPGLAAAFEELAGGADKAESAKISFDQFNKALQEGKLKSLEPYNGALNEINNTLVGKFKGGLAVLKESLTVLGSTSYKELFGAKSPYAATTGKGTGMSMVDAAKAPIDQLVRSIQGMLVAIGPSLLRVFPQLTAGLADPLSKAMERLTYWIIAGVEKLDGMSGSLDGIIGKTRMVFSTIATYVTNAAAPFDSLWNNFIKPVAEGIGSLLNGVVQHFGEVANENASALANWGTSIKGILENLTGFLEVIAEVKKALAPVISSLLKFLQLLTKVFGNPIGRTVVALGLIAAALTKITWSLYRMGVAAKQAMASVRGAAAGTATATNAAATKATAGGFFSRLNTQWSGSGGMGGLAIGGGLAAGATMVGGMISSRSAATDAQGQAVGGALSAAGVGAMMGALAGPAGMAIGAAAGGVIGGVLGALNAKDAKEEKRRDVKRSTIKYLEGISASQPSRPLKAEAEAMARARRIPGLARRYARLTDTGGILGNFGGGGISRLQELEDRVAGDRVSRLSVNERADLKRLRAEKKAIEREFKAFGGTGSPKGALQGARQFIAGQSGRLQKLSANKLIGDLFGFDIEQLGAYAKRHNKSLTATALGIKDMIKLLGYSGKLAKNGAATAADMGVASDRLYQQLTERTAATKKLTQAGIDAVNRMTQFITEGRTGQSADQAAYNAADTMDTIVARQTGRYSAGMFGAGGYKAFATQTTAELTTFYEGAKRAGVTNENLNALLAQMLPVIAMLNTNTTNLQARLEVDALLAGELNAWVAEATAQIESLPDDFSMESFLDVKTQTILNNLEARGIEIKPETATQVRQMLANSFAGPDGASNKMTEALAAGGRSVAASIRSAFGSAKLRFAIKINGKKQVINVNGVPVEAPDDEEDTDDTSQDTATPRFARTMARHAALNSMIAGKRTITSGIRTNNLGSINSDHRFGYAYDLVGQNLGAYAANVKRGGGFAEFHGTGGSRHLHVVPGQGIGDTSTPIGPIGGGASMTTNNINIQVYAPEGSSPAAIADEVMTRIRHAQRDAVERR